MIYASDKASSPGKCTNDTDANWVKQCPLSLPLHVDWSVRPSYGEVKTAVCGPGLQTVAIFYASYISPPVSPCA
jgi:hypothetical protein